jgi:NADH dehydrogenase
MTVSSKRRRILILGGGFAGVYTAKYLLRGLKRRGLDDVDVALASRENYLTFQPLLPEVISGCVNLLHAISPIRRIVPGLSLYARGVESVDLSRRVVSLAPDFTHRGIDLEFDHLVLALGNQLATGLVPGLTEHAVPFKYLGDALRLRHHLMHVLEEAAIAEDPDERRRLLTFVVGGGGFSGVECMAEMNDFLLRAIRNFKTIQPSELQFVLVQSAATILPEMKPSLAQFAHRVLEKRGIRIETNSRLVAVTALSAVTSNKSTGAVVAIPTRTVVATVPTEPHPIISKLEAAKQGGRIVVTPQLHVDGAPNLWAIGDCAAAPTSKGVAPPTAQHAVRQAGLCAENILASLTGAPLKAYDFESLGTLASLGGRSAVAEVMGVKLSGFLAWIMWRGVYLAKFPGWDRKLKILLDWITNFIVPRDVTQLRIFPPRQVRREHFEPNETVFLKDDHGDRVYFVISGEAAVEINGSTVNTVGAGGVFGEIALISDRPRAATVRAQAPLDVVSVDRQAFEALVAHFPGVRNAMQEIMERHLQGAAANVAAREESASPS